MTLTIEIPGMKPVTIDVKSEMAALHEIEGWAKLMVKKAIAGELAKIILEIRDSNEQQRATNRR
jgi:hypothetical protein